MAERSVVRTESVKRVGEIAETVEIFHVPRFVHELVAVVLPVDIQQKTAERAKLRRRHGHAADAAGARS